VKNRCSRIDCKFIKQLKCIIKLQRDNDGSNEVFSGYQPRQVSALNRHFEDHLGHHIRDLMRDCVTER